MYALPCSHCKAILSVSPARAGEDLPCPECQQSTRVPSLGKLKSLPRVDNDVSERSVLEEPSRGGLWFSICGGLATLTLIAAGFCGIRYSLIAVPNTSQGHANEMKELYRSAGAAELIREYENMEEFRMELALPYKYKQVAIEKEQWGRSMIAACLASGCLLLGAAGFAIRDRQATRKK